MKRRSVDPAAARAFRRMTVLLAFLVVGAVVGLFIWVKEPPATSTRLDGGPSIAGVSSTRAPAARDPMQAALVPTTASNCRPENAPWLARPATRAHGHAPRRHESDEKCASALSQGSMLASAFQAAAGALLHSRALSSL
jgi:hypothetical protein